MLKLQKSPDYYKGQIDLLKCLIDTYAELASTDLFATTAGEIVSMLISQQMMLKKKLEEDLAELIKVSN